MMTKEKLTDLRHALNTGLVIPAHPLAVDKDRKLDERRQRALSRYYLDAGAGGLAIGVHTTQFEIREANVGLLEPVLNLAMEERGHYVAKTNRSNVMIAGVIGSPKQLIREAELAQSLGYDAALLSLSAMKDADNDTLIESCRAVAGIIPVVGFYMQTAVGGRPLDLGFWHRFAEIENVVAVKIAPFDRYKTLDVARAIIESGRSNEIALYTGNDDNILLDLVTVFKGKVNGTTKTTRIVGGLLGHWAVWTQKAVELLERVKAGAFEKSSAELLTLNNRITDSNAAFFDAANDFAGCIVGLHEVLRRQGLLEGVWTLNENEVLSPQQSAEIDRVYSAYPELNDDSFVAENVARWLA